MGSFMKITPKNKIKVRFPTAKGTVVFKNRKKASKKLRGEKHKKNQKWEVSNA